MTETQRSTIERARAKLRGSALDELTREQLEHALDCSGAATNGTPDKINAIAEAVHALTVGLAHFAADAPAYSEGAARRAVADCPMRQAHVSRPWREVAQEAALRSPLALALVICPVAVALILRGFGGVLLQAIGVG